MNGGLDKYMWENAANIWKTVKYFASGSHDQLSEKPAIVCVTSNQHKLSEYRTLLGMKGLLSYGNDFPDIADSSIEAVAVRKLKLAQEDKKLKRVPFFLEVSGLEVQTLGGLPGGLTRHFIDRIKAAGICRLLRSFEEKERQATAVTAIYFSYKGIASDLFCGRLNGKIATEPQGDGGFDWDTIFIPEGHKKTFAQLGQDVKNQLSPRRIACDQLKVLLQMKGML